MTRSGNPRFDPGTGVGDFLRNYCGPHCHYANSCPQTTGNFAHCYNEERTSQGGEMSRRRRKKKNPESVERKAAKAAYRKLHSRAWLFAPGSGWFVKVKNYEPETIHKEQAGT
jgi:hypothetical protein